MNTKPMAANAREVFSIWRDEDRELEQRLDKIRQRMLQAGKRETSSLAETANHLTEFRGYLTSHFGLELELCEQLCGFYPEPCPEIQAMHRQSLHDHQHLLGQLDALIAKLNSLRSPTTASLQVVIEEVGLFVDTLEQHEAQESESVCALMPHHQR
jgi:hypothetical protein